MKIMRTPDRRFRSRKIFRGKTQPDATRRSRRTQRRTCRPIADDSETESPSGPSDHFRGEQTTESSETSEDEEFQETFLSQLPINEMVMRKGEWRHVKGNASKIREHMQEELERRQKSRFGTGRGTSNTTLAVSTVESHHPAKPGSRQRRRGPLRVIEICTWTCMMSITAASLGWERLGANTVARI